MGTVLAFDFGEQRIGVAVGETLLRQAHPLTTIRTPKNDDRFDAIGRLVAEWQPAELVVGRPAAADGGEHAMTRRCRRFANQLRGRFNLPVSEIDERLTSDDATRRLRDSGLGARRAKEHVDSVAAQLILQGYFDARRAA
jgi:putative Holliday junction resolvase